MTCMSTAAVCAVVSADASAAAVCVVAVPEDAPAAAVCAAAVPEDAPTAAVCTAAVPEDAAAVCAAAVIVGSFCAATSDVCVESAPAAAAAACRSAGLTVVSAASVCRSVHGQTGARPRSRRHIAALQIIALRCWNILSCNLKQPLLSFVCTVRGEILQNYFIYVKSMSDPGLSSGACAVTVQTPAGDGSRQMPPFLSTVLP